MSRPTAAHDEADQDRHERLERAAAAEPDEGLRSSGAGSAKNSGGPNFSATSARSGAKSVMEDDCKKSAPTKDELNAAPVNA